MGPPRYHASDEGGFSLWGSVNPRQRGCLGSYAKEGCLGDTITQGLGGLQIAMPRPRGYAEGACKHHERRGAPPPVGWFHGVVLNRNQKQDPGGLDRLLPVSFWDRLPGRGN